MTRSLPDNREEHSQIKEYLLFKQRQIEEQIVGLEKADPVMDESVVEPPELGTDAWQADVHIKSTAIKGRLKKFSDNIKKSLINLRNGTYGQCEKCGKQIESERLKALPVASMCSICIRLL